MLLEIASPSVSDGVASIDYSQYNLIPPFRKHVLRLGMTRVMRISLWAVVRNVEIERRAHTKLHPDIERADGEHP